MSIYILRQLFTKCMEAKSSLFKVSGKFLDIRIKKCVIFLTKLAKYKTKSSFNKNFS